MLIVTINRDRKIKKLHFQIKKGNKFKLLNVTIAKFIKIVTKIL